MYHHLDDEVTSSTHAFLHDTYPAPCIYTRYVLNKMLRLIVKCKITFHIHCGLNSKIFFNSAEQIIVCYIIINVVNIRLII